MVKMLIPKVQAIGKTRAISSLTPLEAKARPDAKAEVKPEKMKRKVAKNSTMVSRYMRFLCLPEQSSGVPSDRSFLITRTMIGLLDRLGWGCDIKKLSV